MKDIENIYHQIKNREYLKNQLGKDMWIQVSGHTELNTAKVTLWAVFLPIEKAGDAFNSANWDRRIGTQQPGFIGTRSNAEYQRIQYDKNRSENIVNYRSFDGVKPDYVEIVEEFRLLNNLYHDSDTNTYSVITENGECEEVAKIEDRVNTYIKLKYLLRYAAARRLVLMLQFDMEIRFSGGLSENHLKEFSDKYKDDVLCYEIWGNEMDMRDLSTYSILIGKKVIYPGPMEQCGYWPFEKEREYAEFIIGTDNQGESVKSTCNPKYLSDFFGANPGAPNYLTPVFFSKEVLERYYLHPELYSIGDGHLECKSSWDLKIDNHHLEYVSVYLGDLGRDLPESEQNHWMQYNIETSETISKVAFMRDFAGIATESNMADLKFKKHFGDFQNRWRQKYGWNLFLPLSEADQYNINSLRIPIAKSQEEFDHQVLSLVKTIIDSLNEQELSRNIPNKDPKPRGITLLECWLKTNGVENTTDQIKFLRDLQELRSTGTGHRKGKKYEKAKERFNLHGNNFAETFSDILDQADSFLKFMERNFSSDTSKDPKDEFNKM